MIGVESGVEEEEEPNKLSDVEAFFSGLVGIDGDLESVVFELVTVSFLTGLDGIIGDFDDSFGSLVVFGLTGTGGESTCLKSSSNSFVESLRSSLSLNLFKVSFNDIGKELPGVQLGCITIYNKEVGWCSRSTVNL
ncbi:hypothetical protein WICPIJ_006231 [Wickerhamomyces pijperi]|uniref:Uncharacterized protein n=1 Tax=Wickerhamomyces pijperi TaxID=599730 RepID=A0A9P8Q261_WICPI|nr:hypothetical protein WICPIJ_006231 [Wickerhamomyces pijperi]